MLATIVFLGFAMLPMFIAVAPPSKSERSAKAKRCDCGEVANFVFSGVKRCTECMKILVVNFDREKTK